jgi:adenosylhomocysteinase
MQPDLMLVLCPNNLFKIKAKLNCMANIAETEDYSIKDISLAEQGRQNISYSISEMPVLTRLKARFEAEKPLAGIRVGMALHITTETAYLVDTLVAGGAEVAICSCNPLSSQDDSCAYLAAKGVKVFGYKGETKEDYYRFISKVIEFRPQITVDDGCDLVTELHNKHPELLKGVIGGSEETTTGVRRLLSMEHAGALKYPMIAVNDNFTKHMFDNFYGTGQSAMDGIIRASNILVAGKTVVVLGYGPCGKGVALRARALGANVIVTEVCPKMALQALMDGYRVMKFRDAAPLGNIFVTVTGNLNVIPFWSMGSMKEGAILSNAGHFDNEIELGKLEAEADEKEEVRPLFVRYKLGGKNLYVCGEGRLVNLACAEGHPSSVLDMSFAGQALAVEHLVKNQGQLKPGVIYLPEELDIEIAKIKLEEIGIELDELTPEQMAYLEGWQEGT